MMIRLAFCLLLFCCCQPALAKPIVADISAREIKIDSSFTGTDLLLFGARNEGGDIVIVVRGPEMSYRVRQKERIAGIWVNRRQVQFDQVPAFYTVVASRSLDALNNPQLLARLGLGLPRLLPETPANKKPFQQALYAHQQKQLLFAELEEDLSFVGQMLFRSFIHFPDNIPKGDYTAEVYLFDDGNLVGTQIIPLEIRKTGFDAVVYELAYQYPGIYGTFAILMALCAGWVASAMFKNR